MKARALLPRGIVLALVASWHAGGVGAQPWILESAPTIETLNAVTHDGEFAYAVGNLGVILRRPLSEAPGAGTWTALPSPTSADLLDVACRPGVGCAASGWDVVVTDVGGEFEVLVDTAGQGRPYAPVWVFDDAVMYGEIGVATPLNFLWREPFSGTGLGVSIGNEPIMSMCERAGQLYGVTRFGEVKVFDPDLATMTTQVIAQSNLGLSVGSFDPATCAVTPGALIEPRRGGGLATAYAMAPPTIAIDFAAWIFILVVEGPIDLDLANAEMHRLVNRRRPRAVPSRGGAEPLAELVLAGQTGDLLPASWTITIEGDRWTVSPPEIVQTVVGRALVGIGSVDVANSPGVTMELAVGTDGLIATRTVVSAEIFGSDFETGNTDEWSSTVGL